MAGTQEPEVVFVRQEIGKDHVAGCLAEQVRIRAAAFSGDGKAHLGQAGGSFQHCLEWFISGKGIDHCHAELLRALDGQEWNGDHRVTQHPGSTALFLDHSAEKIVCHQS